ncbi:Pycsar system effector family protein [Streptomyces sp. BYX5S]
MTRVAPPPDDSRLKAGTRLLADLRAEITRADTKATVLVGAHGIVAGALGTLLNHRRWTPGALSPPAALLWWSGTVSLVVALLCLLMAVMPRYRRKGWAPGRPLTYFGDIHDAARTGHLANALADTGQNPARGLLLSLTETSRIAARKHFWIRAGVTAFGCAAVLIAGSLLIA